MSIIALAGISEQLGNFAVSGRSINSTVSPFYNIVPFEAPFPATVTSIMWTTSLIISLATTSWALVIGIWIDELMEYTEHLPRQQVIFRFHAHATMDMRGVFFFAVTARYWLYIATLLFLLGLEMFMFAQNMVVGVVAAAGVLLWRGYFLFKGIPVLSLSSFYDHNQSGFLHTGSFLKYMAPNDIQLSSKEVYNNTNFDLVSLIYARDTLPPGEIDQAILEVLKNRYCNDLSSMASSNLIATLPKSSVRDMLLFMVRAMSSRRPASLGIGMENRDVFRNMYLNFGSTLRSVVLSRLNDDEDHVLPEDLVPELLDLIHDDPITAGFSILAMCSLTSHILTNYPHRWDSLFKLKKWSTVDGMCPIALCPYCLISMNSNR